MLLKHLGAALPASLDGLLHKIEALSATGKVRFCVLDEAVGTPTARLCPGCQEHQGLGALCCHGTLWEQEDGCGGVLRMDKTPSLTWCLVLSPLMDQAGAPGDAPALSSLGLWSYRGF